MKLEDTLDKVTKEDRKVFRLLALLAICLIVGEFAYNIGYKAGYLKTYNQYYEERIKGLEEGR